MSDGETVSLEECTDNHTGESVEALKRAIMDNLYYREARLPAVATRNDWYLALAYVVRDRIVSRWIRTIEAIVKKDVRVVSYLSAEFLMGPHLVNNMINRRRNRRGGLCPDAHAGDGGSGRGGAR